MHYVRTMITRSLPNLPKPDSNYFSAAGEREPQFVRYNKLDIKTQKSDTMKS